ncbi:hypothetical protein [Xanthocytophaga agilis]|uniref:Uncharacterized protein n=1 Tax=Xanthocytophaga agilis TaxID=3048010 RepID=A0AAE3UC78_9BACT|nr:hypothetical protein [Xanthocytophaga agilis]MDJ1500653.1 hypothetical protein [Xanthocytophaga agilis]
MHSLFECFFRKGGIMTGTEFIQIVDELIDTCLQSEELLSIHQKSEVIQKLLDAQRMLTKTNKEKCRYIFRSTTNHLCKKAALAYCYNSEIQIENLALIERFFLIERTKRVKYFKTVEQLLIR